MNPEHVFSAAVAIQRELLLFAAVGFALGGIDDLVVDLIYLSRRSTARWRRRCWPRRVGDLPPSRHPGAFAVLVPAWDESNVIGPMLQRTRSAWSEAPVTLFVGTYRNDPATIAIVQCQAQADERIISVIVPHDGPTTKADCLNSLWRAVQGHEEAGKFRFKGVILHDAEDVVHADAPRLFDRLLDDLDMVQLPVLPIPSQRSRWISRHYCDEFSESHGRGMVVRQHVGAAIPSAGVGCAFRRTAMEGLARERGGDPFDPESLTEDYELGLRIAAAGGRTAIIRMRDDEDRLIATQEVFPETLAAAVRQKARWSVGIAWLGWDRLGWVSGAAETWMRLRDRRDPLAALILAAAYLAAAMEAPMQALRVSLDLPSSPLPPMLAGLLICNLAFLVWRMACRAAFVGASYGWRQGLLSIPRILVANVVSILAAGRALLQYMAIFRGQPVRWEKTRHRFPAAGEFGG